MSRICKLDGRKTTCTDNCNSCMNEERVYTLYTWALNGECGYGVCKKEDFPPKTNHHIERIGDFKTAFELEQLIIAYNPDYPEILAKSTAEGLMEGLKGETK